MSKKVKKETAIDTIKKSDPLEVTLLSIKRDEPESQKRQKLSSFLKIVNEYINDTRDVHLVAVKEM